MATRLRTVIIPAAGKGTRLRPATRVTAKELLPVYDRVAIDFAMAEAVEAGAERIIVVISPAKTAIQDYLQGDPNFAVDSIGRSTPMLVSDVRLGPTRIEFVFQDQPRGLGDAILCCAGHTLAGPIGVILPDDVIFGAGCLAEMAADHVDGQMVAAMHVSPDATQQYGIFHVKALPAGKCVPVSGMVEKPAPGTAPSSLAAVGRYILTPSIFEILRHTPTGAGGELQLTDAIAIATRGTRLTAFRFSGDRYDCGNHEGLLAASVARQAIVMSERAAPRRAPMPAIVEANQAQRFMSRV